MAKRKQHSPEQIVRKLQTAERLTSEGASDDEIARELDRNALRLAHPLWRYGRQ